ncbi:hypothetical protein B0I35DRAFT_478089 [Stachybotrys elegans]|uniref:Uncharacterized protein n=1 Tax=Stachybotrys elegans TaxID=80388 RepID=A0A8K0SR26_9HYPO|nr:hypothetical protein B0I35DRAFT_478089 [Stachybotrys elegans]
MPEVQGAQPQPTSSASPKQAITKDDILADDMKDFLWLPRQKPRPNQFTGPPKPNPISGEHPIQGNLVDAATANRPPLQDGLLMDGPLHLPDVDFLKSPLKSLPSARTQESMHNFPRPQAVSPSVRKTPQKEKAEYSHHAKSSVRALQHASAHNSKPIERASALEQDQSYTEAAQQTIAASDVVGRKHIYQSPQQATKDLQRPGKSSRPPNTGHFKDKAVHHRKPPPSVCGDLEGPIHHTPSRSESIFAKIRATDYHSPRSKYIERQDASDRRSSSRTSNISRKRATIQKPRSQPHIERRHDLMRHISHSWNEWVTINKEELDQAHEKIERLAKEKREYKEALIQTETSLGELRDELQETQASCDALNEQHRAAQDQNSALQGEVQTLREGVADSEKRAAKFNDKYLKVKTRLNEAIEEQQDLYKRSEEYYRRMKKELEELKEDAENRRVATEAFNKAIEESSRIRRETKLCIEALRSEMKQEIASRDCVIDQLKQTIADKNEELSRERSRFEDLHSNLDSHNDLDKAIQPLDDKLRQLLMLCDGSNVRYGDRSEADEQLKRMLDDCLRHLTALLQNERSSVDVESIGATVQDVLEMHIFPALQSMMQKQDDSHLQIANVETGVLVHLGDLKNMMCSGAETSRQMYEDERRFGQQISELCTGINQRLDNSQDAFARIEQQLISDSEHRIRELQECEHAGLTQQLEERQRRIGELEQQLVLAKNDCSDRIQSLASLVETNDRGLQDRLEELATDLHLKLDQSFQLEKEHSSQKLIDSETRRVTIENQLAEARQKLKKLEADQNAVEQQDRSTTAQLLEKIQHLENQARATGELRERWSHDNEVIGSLRSQLSSMLQAMPRLEDVQGKLNDIQNMNQCIHSTANYLRTEREWVQQQLQNRQQPSPHPARATPEGQSLQFNTNGEELKGASTQEKDIRRKVVVNSPSIEKSPSPPSVQQEQHRRRMGTQPRSILKFTTTSAPEQSGASVFLRKSHNHSQYNRPMVGSRGGPSEEGSKKVEEIISVLVPRPQSESELALPTVAEFESRRLSNPGEGAKRQMSEPIEEQAFKRPRA